MIYAIDKDKNHRIIKRENANDLYNKGFEIVSTDADGWIKWYGEAVAPLPDNSRYEWKTKGGKKFTGWKPQHLTWTQVAAYLPILETCTPEEDEAWKEKDMKLNGEAWKVGDYVNGGNDQCKYKYEIIAIHDHWAWLRASDGSSERGVLYPLSMLTTYDSKEDEAVDAIAKFISDNTAGLFDDEPYILSQAIYRAIKSGELKL